MTTRVYYPATSVTLEVRWEGPDRSKNYGKTLFEGIMPMRYVVENNGVRAADTIKKLEFDARDFPFDPRLQRSTEIAVFLGLRDNGDAPYKPRSVISSGGDVEVVDTLFVGFADQFKRKRGEHGDVIEIEGRDYTGIFLDTPYKSSNLPSGDTLDGILQGMIDELPAAKNVTLCIEAGADTWVSHGQVVKPPKGRVGARGRAATKVKITDLMGKGTKAHGHPAAIQHSYWDVIQELCDKLGLIAFMQGAKLIVTPPRNLSDAGRQGAPLLVWGYNLSSLEVDKHIGRLRAPNVEVACLKPGANQVLFGRYPDPPIPHTIVTGGPEEQKQINIHRYAMRGLQTKAQCARAAQRIYEEITSNEIAFKLGTRELKAFSADQRGRAAASAGAGGTLGGENVDLTQVRDGWPIAIDTDPDLRDLLTGASQGERVNLLVQKGYKRNVAVALAAHWDDLGRFESTYRVQTAKHEWDVKHGYKLEIDAINYLNVGDPT